MSKKVTLQDVAEFAGVGLATVDRVINERGETSVKTTAKVIEAAKAVGLVLPELAGKLNGSAVRVPTPNVSMVDLVFDAARETTVDEVNALIKEASEGAMKGVLDYSTAPLVSADFNHNPASSTLAADGTNVTDGKLVRILTWYDNEWGFATRMSDTALALAKFL